VSATNEALARRWMASKHWGGWRAGMVSNQSAVCCTSQKGWGTSDPVVWADTSNSSWIFAEPDAGELPDLDHPGTRAFLLQDVRRAWGPESYVDTFALFGGASCIRVLAPNRPHFKTADHDTEAEALIAALEAALGE